MPSEKEFIQNIAYFKGMDASELEAINILVFEQHNKRGEMLLLEGDPGNAVYFVASGTVKLFKTSAEGKEQILYLVGPGESFNDVSALDRGLNEATAQAISDVTLYGIKAIDLDSIVRKYPKVGINISQVLAARIRILSSLIEDLSFKHVIGRVAGILLKYAGDGPGPKPRLTQQEMAAMAGTAREVVGRSLKMLESDGAIRMDRHRIVISNKEVLENMVDMSV